ncbi:MAG: hypothetical protein Q9212_006215, partial [Teloschistes hypoglaucus]
VEYANAPRISKTLIVVTHLPTWVYKVHIIVLHRSGPCFEEMLAWQGVLRTADTVEATKTIEATQTMETVETVETTSVPYERVHPSLNKSLALIRNGTRASHSNRWCWRGTLQQIYRRPFNNLDLHLYREFD